MTFKQLHVLGWRRWLPVFKFVPCRKLALEGPVAGAVQKGRNVEEMRQLPSNKLEDKMEEERKNNLKTNIFLANLGHEIRTPLSSIIGFAELLEKEHYGPIKREKFISIIRSNAQHLSTLLVEIMDLSRIESGQLTLEKSSVNLDTEINSIFSAMRIKAKDKGIELKLQYETPIPESISTDPDRFRQILLYVIGYTIRTAAKGLITISVRLNKDTWVGSGNLLQLKFLSEEGNVLFAGDPETAFDPFGPDTKTKAAMPNLGGTGLELSLARKLARLLGGDVALSKGGADMGSSFVIELDPGNLSSEALAEGKASGKAVTEKMLQEKEYSLLGVKVLLVEDNIFNQMLFKRFLNSVGAEVMAVGNGERGVEMALQNNFDVILMDLRLPAMDGCMAASLMREKGVTTPIIALTAQDSREERERGMNAGCNDYRSKPIGVEELRQVVAHWGRRLPAV